MSMFVLVMIIVVVIVVMMMVMMLVLMGRIIIVVMMVMMTVVVFMLVPVRMAVLVLEMDVELRPLYLKTLRPLRVQVITVQLQLLQFALELAEINAQIQHRADKHIAANAAEDVEIESLH